MLEIGEPVHLSQSPTALAVCEALGSETVYARARLSQSKNDTVYNPYFGAVYTDCSVRKFVCKFQDKKRVGQFMQMIDHKKKVDHLLPLEFDLIEVFNFE